MLGGYISDLDTGDVFESVSYVVTPMMTTEYAHSVEDTFEWFHSASSPDHRQVRPPTMVHIDKLRILEANCPKEARLAGMKGPDARIHYEYHARHRGLAYVGDELTVSGHIAERFVKRDRTYLRYELVVHNAAGDVITEYWDQTLLKYAPGEVG
jgi:hypothetical protein